MRAVLRAFKEKIAASGMEAGRDAIIHHVQSLPNLTDAAKRMEGEFGVHTRDARNRHKAEVYAEPTEEARDAKHLVVVIEALNVEISVQNMVEYATAASRSATGPIEEGACAKSTERIAYALLLDATNWHEATDYVQCIFAK